MGDTIYLTLFVPINVVNNMQYLQLSNRSYTCSKFIFTFIFFFPSQTCKCNAPLPSPLPPAFSPLFSTMGTEIRCVQGLPLWRDNTSVINDELFNGYKKGNTGEKINEFVAGNYI